MNWGIEPSAIARLPARDYIARRQAEGKSTREATRCLKRYLTRHVWRLLQAPHPDKEKLSSSIS